MMIRLLVLCAASLLATSGFAQLYKWVDKDGNVRYSDRPPVDAKASQLKPLPAAPSAPAAGTAAAGKKDEKPLTPEQAFQKRQKEQEEQVQKAQKDRAEADANKLNCDVAQANLRTAESGQRMSSTDKTGERVYLSDAQVAKAAELARQAVKDWCK